MAVVRLKPPDIEGKAWFGAINARFPNLRNLYLCNDQGVTLRDAGQRNHGTLANSAFWGSGPIGRVVCSSRSGSKHVDLGTPYPSGNCTIAVIATKTASTPGGGNLDPVWFTRTSGSAGFGFDLGNSFDGTYPQRPHFSLFGGGTANAWVNGKLQAAGSGSFDQDATVGQYDSYVLTASGVSGAESNYLGRANIFYGNVNIALVLYWTRVLSNGECEDISGAMIETLFSPPSSQVGWRFTGTSPPPPPPFVPPPFDAAHILAARRPEMIAA